MLLGIVRKFSTSRPLHEALLSSNYRSKKLWDERYNCPMLTGDEEQLKAINNKIISGNQLTCLEVDMFINIASPREEDTVQLEESVKLLRTFRRSIYAHTQLPSTAHGITRLFLNGRRLKSLVNLLDKRVEFGIFPDLFAFNLILDEAIDKEMYHIAAKVASLIMLQEEFGVNPITDRLALFSMFKYIESNTNFSDWPICDISQDPILSSVLEQKSAIDQAQDEAKDADGKKEEEAAEEDEDEEDAQYIRVPFLRNPYNDQHFDLTNPRLICGKTFKALSAIFSQVDDELGRKAQLIGSILLGEWKESVHLLDELLKDKTELGQLVDHAIFYVENLHGVQDCSEEEKSKIIDSLGKVTKGKHLSISELVKSKHLQLEEHEEKDIAELRSRYSEWSNIRLDCRRRDLEKIEKEELIKQIKAKREELRLKEQYLYFYDNLRSSRLTKVAYE